MSGLWRNITMDTNSSTGEYWTKPRRWSWELGRTTDGNSMPVRSWGRCCRTKSAPLTRQLILRSIAFYLSGRPRLWDLKVSELHGKFTYGMFDVPKVHKVYSSPEKHVAAMPTKKTNWDIMARKDLFRWNSNMALSDSESMETYRITTWFERAKNANLRDKNLNKTKAPEKYTRTLGRGCKPHKPVYQMPWKRLQLTGIWDD